MNTKWTPLRSPKLFLTILDQGASSLSNVLGLVLVARWGGRAELGGVSAAMSAVTTLLAVARMSLGSRISSAAPLGPQAVRAESGSALAALAMASPVCILAVAAIGFVGMSGALSIPVLIIAIATPIVLMQDMLRFAANASGAPEVAAQSDITWLGLLVASIPIGLVLASPPGPILATAVWGSGAILAYAIAARRQHIWPEFVGLWVWAHKNASAISGTGAAALGQAVAALARLGLIGWFSETGTLGVIAGGVLLFAPVNLLQSLVVFGAMPVIATRARGRNDTCRYYGLLAVAGGMLIAAWASILWSIPKEVMTDLVGASWAASLEVIVPVCMLSIATFGFACGTGAMLSLGSSWGVLGASSLAGVLSVVGALVGCFSGWDANAYLWIDACAFSVGSVAAWVAALRIAQRSGPFGTEDNMLASS